MRYRTPTGRLKGMAAKRPIFQALSFGLGMLGLLIHSCLPAAAQTRYAPGISDTEIKIGQTMPYSGPASAYRAIGMAERAYLAMINDQGGINGRKINLIIISVDDGYSPPKTFEQTRKLVEQGEVAFIFSRNAHWRRGTQISQRKKDPTALSSLRRDLLG
jgi:ABC-type branched-subunit amino acid transport system substrate-binding protein